jgi:hypothetical protein
MGIIMTSTPILTGIAHTAAFAQAGDIVAFSGSAFVSKLIEDISGGVTPKDEAIPSHVAMIIPPEMLVDGKAQAGVSIIESTSKNQGRSGPQINTLAEEWTTYPAGSKAWLLSLNPRWREFLDWEIVWDVAAKKLVGESYNYLELGDYVLRKLPFVSYVRQIYKGNAHEEVCSELMANLFQAGGMPGLHPPMVSPEILTSFRIFGEITQLEGAPATIKGYNTL